MDRAEQELFITAMRKLREQITDQGMDKETLDALKELAALSNDMKKAYEEAVADTMQHVAGREDSLLRTYAEVRKAEAEHGGGPDAVFNGRINGVPFSDPSE